jgi:hypothetical protein
MCCYTDASIEMKKKEGEKENKSLGSPVLQGPRWLAGWSRFRFYYFIGCPSTEKLIT